MAKGNEEIERRGCSQERFAGAGRLSKHTIERNDQKATVTMIVEMRSCKIEEPQPETFAVKQVPKERAG